MKKILIVDDQPDVKELLQVVLKREDRQFFLADNGEEALDIAREIRPELVLMDVMMPGGMDGHEAARILKLQPETTGCYVITITAKVQQKDREYALACGSDDFVGKPFNIRDLTQKVDRILSGEIAAKTPSMSAEAAFPSPA